MCGPPLKLPFYNKSFQGILLLKICIYLIKNGMKQSTVETQFFQQE